MLNPQQTSWFLGAQNLSKLGGGRKPLNGLKKFVCLTSSLPFIAASCHSAACVERWKLQNVQLLALLMYIEIWSCHSFVHRNGEIVYRQICRACDGKSTEHMMSTCTVVESTHCRVVLTSSVPVLLKLWMEDYFYFFLACPSLPLQTKDMQSNNELSLRVATNTQKAAAILFLNHRGLVGRFHTPWWSSLIETGDFRA